MSRIEENKNLLNALLPYGKEIFTLVKPDLEADASEVFRKAILTDISKSLAVIADTLSERNKKNL